MLCVGVKLFFFFSYGQWTSAIKSWAKSIIFRHFQLPEDFLSNEQKTTEGGGVQRFPPRFGGLKEVFKLLFFLNLKFCFLEESMSITDNNCYYILLWDPLVNLNSAVYQCTSVLNPPPTRPKKQKLDCNSEIGQHVGSSLLPV